MVKKLIESNAKKRIGSLTRKCNNNSIILDEEDEFGRFVRNKKKTLERKVYFTPINDNFSTLPDEVKSINYKRYPLIIIENASTFIWKYPPKPVIIYSSKDGHFRTPYSPKLNIHLARNQACHITQILKKLKHFKVSYSGWYKREDIIQVEEKCRRMNKRSYSIGSALKDLPFTLIKNEK